MGKSWIVIEKVLAVIVLSLSILNAYFLWRVYETYAQYQPQEMNGYAISFLLSWHLIVVISILGLLGSLLLLMRKKTGWILSASFLLITSILVLKNFFLHADNQLTQKEFTFQLIVLTFVALVLVSIILLLNSWFRRKYQIEFRQLLLTAAIVVVLLTDSLLLPIH